MDVTFNQIKTSGGLDLWGELDLSPTQPNSMLTLIQQQAGLLISKTNGLVSAHLQAYQDLSSGHNGVNYHFILHCPTLAYSQNLFSVKITFDPYTVELRHDRKSTSTTNRDELIKALQSILSASRTRDILSHLTEMAKIEKSQRDYINNNSF